MPSTFSQNKNIELIATGEETGIWGTHTNANWAIMDAALGGHFSLSLSSSNVTLSTTQAQNLAMTLTGTLTANVEVIYPAGGGFFLVTNNTTGAFTVTLITSAVGAVGVVIPTGGPFLVQTDGTTFFLVAGPPGWAGPIGVVNATAAMPARRLVAVNNTSAAPITITWSASPYDGEEHEIVDYGQNASTYPITVKTSGGTVLAFLQFNGQSVIITYSAALGGYIIH